MIMTGTVSRNRPTILDPSTDTMVTDLSQWQPKHALTPSESLAVEKSLADCDDPGWPRGWGCIEPWCRVHAPEQYAKVWAQHRADEPHHQCDTYHPEGDPCPEWAL